MKNLIVFISPRKQLYGEYAVLIKVQIDNALDLGWKPEDILFVTNFNYEYNGVKSIIVGDKNFCAVRPRSIKTSIIPHLVDEGIMEDGKVYWNHDFDAFQINSMSVSELGLEGLDAGFTDYGWRTRWCLGSAFIKTSARDIFTWLREGIFVNLEDETILGKITDRNTHKINSRIKKMNITYQIGMRHVEHNYELATKPLKVLHFHPHKPGLLDIFMHGKNGINTPFMTDRMIKVFHHHGLK